MPVKVLADSRGNILFSQGDPDKKYGIASQSKAIATMLIHEQIQKLAAAQGVSVDTILNQRITARVDYGEMVYDRMQTRRDLTYPDDPKVFRPFLSDGSEQDKSAFRLPVEQGKAYSVRELFKAALFESKNDAIQALSDHFFNDFNNKGLQAAFAEMKTRLKLDEFPERDERDPKLPTRLETPHGLNDGGNTFTARDLAKVYGELIRNHLDFFRKFDPNKAARHTVKPLMHHSGLKAAGIDLDAVKSGTGNDRVGLKGNSSSSSLMAVGGRKNGPRFSAVVLADGNRVESVANLLLKMPHDTAPAPAVQDEPRLIGPIRPAVREHRPQ
ncbi:MAG: hypothetical protein HY053_02110 [Proteobacteria bacterium]|nr:hypothetical protein [Pseudomonadota bacterium]